MKNLIRKATLLSGCALLVAAAAYAGAPSSANSCLEGQGSNGNDCSTSDPANRKGVGIRLVGTSGFGPNAADIAGNVTFTIRDAVPNVIPNAVVTINFGGCPQIRLCDNGSAPDGVCVGPNGQGTASGTTDINGQVTFTLVGSTDVHPSSPNANFPEPDVGTCPGSNNQGYFGCATVTVTAPGFPPAAYPNLITSAFKMALGDPAVGSGDLGVCVTDVLSGNYRERSDFDTSVNAGGAGCLNSGDLGQMINVALTGGSSVNCPLAGNPCP